MKTQWFVVGVIGLVMVGWCGVSHADVLSIHDIQYYTSDGDASIYDGETHHVTSGIVTHIWHGFNDRVYLQDPDHPTWGAIVVKDAEDGELSNNVSVGDEVSFEHIYIQEYRGTTFLQYRRSLSENVAFTVESSGNPVPPPTMLTAADVEAPIYDDDPVTGGWFVENHNAEPYESALVTLENLTVEEMDHGKAHDNYQLLQGDDRAWAADYMQDLPPGFDYDPRIMIGAELESVTGIVEQYTKSYDTPPSWDYYQVCTRFPEDIVPEPATITLLAAGLLLVARRRLS